MLSQKDTKNFQVKAKLYKSDKKVEPLQNIVNKLEELEDKLENFKFETIN